METHLQQLTNGNASPWNLCLPIGSNVSSSEVSEDDADEFFDDTYSDVENIHNESEKSSRHEDAEQHSLNIRISQSIDLKIQESLMKRVVSLKEEIINLHHSLSEEHRLWKQECEEYDRIYEKMKFTALEEATAVARKASEAYVIESAKGHFPSIHSCNRAPASPSNVNSAFTVHRNILNNDYYKKLDQVERLCNQELLKIRNDADALQPLQQIASQWDVIDDKKQ